MQTIPLQKAFEIAKQDPNSAFAVQLRRSIESGALDQAAAKQGVDLTPFGRPPVATPVTGVEDIADRNILDRAADFVGGATYGLSAPGRTVQNLLSKGVEKITGKEDFGAVTKEGFEKSTGTDVDTTSGKVGQFAGETALFAIPGSQAATATKGASMLTRAVAQGATAAGVQAAKTGDIGKDELVAAIFGAASVPAGDAIGVAARNLSTKFPEWLVKPLLKQAKDAKVAGKDIAPFLVDSGRIGSVDSLITQSQTAIDDISTKVAESLAKSSKAGVIVPKANIVDDVVARVNEAGGAISPDDVIGIVDNLAPQARGLLAKDTLTLVEANKLRSLIDQTLGDRAFVSSQLPFNKDVLKMFTNTLRETVKNNGDETLRPLFENYAKNITLRNALVERASSGGGVNSVGLYDLITGVGAFGATGNPVATAIAIGGRRAFESAAVKTTLAQVFKNTDKVAQVLATASPEIQGAILQLVTSLADETKNTDDNQ
jgi:hypothetical protein